MIMKNLKALAIGLLLTLASPLAAFAQCSGNAPASTYCGNPTVAQALPGWKPFSGIPLPNIAGGTVLGNRGTVSAAASPLTNPILGIPGTSTGEIGLAGITSGTATIRAQPAAGSPILLTPNTSGTLAANATSPLVLSAVTGTLTCPTCVTSSGGGAITGTAPIAVSAAGVVSINAPYVTLTASNGGIVYSGAANLAILAGTATARQMLQSGAGAAPAWSTTTWPATTTINRILYSSAANVIGEITTANSSILVTDSGGIPSLSTTLPAFTLGGTVSGGGNQINNVIIGTSTPLAGSFTSLAYSTTLTGTSTNAACAGIGPSGNTNPVFRVNCAGASSATGIVINGAAAGSGVGIVALSSGTNENLTLQAKGTATLGLQGTTITLDAATSAAATINLGGFAGGGVTVNIGAAGDGLNALNVYTGAGSLQTWVSGGGSTTVTFPTATDTLVGKATTDTLTNKTLVGGGTNTLGGVNMTLGSDATGDIYYRTGGVLTRLGIGSSNNLLSVSGGIPSWAATATAAQLEAGTAAKVLTSDIIYDAEITLTHSGTPTWDFNTFLNARETLTSNITSLTCSNIKASQSGAITLVQDGTGSRTMVAGWCSQFRWAGGVRGVLSTAASSIDTLFYQCISTTICYVSLSKAEAN